MDSNAATDPLAADTSTTDLAAWPIETPATFQENPQTPIDQDGKHRWPSCRCHDEPMPPHVQPERGPDNLVGIPYAQLTNKQSWVLKVWRFGQSRCTHCGYHQHIANECPKNKRLLASRKKRKQCLTCGSRAHTEACPVIQRLKKAVGRFPGQHDPVPKELRGIAPSQYTAYDRSMLHQYYMTHGVCFSCKQVHEWYSCKKRAKKLEKAHEAKLRAVASGELVLNTTFASTLTKLPVEVRLPIFRWRSCASSTQNPPRKNNMLLEPVVVRPGYIPSAIRKTGLPYRETLEGWLRWNVFAIDSIEALKHFRSMLSFRGLGLNMYVRSLQLKYVELVDPYANSFYDDWYNIVNLFPNRKKFSLPVPHAQVCDWRHDDLELGDAINRYVKNLKLQRFSQAGMKSVKGLLFIARDFNFGGFGAETVLPMLVEKAKAVLKSIGRMDVYVEALAQECDHDERWGEI